MPAVLKRIRLLLLYLVILLPAIILGASRALQSNNNSPVDWVTSEFAARQKYDQFVAVFGPGDAVVASWPGCHWTDQRLDRVLRAWRQAPLFRDSAGQPFFHRVICGRDVLRTMVLPEESPPSVVQVSAASDPVPGLAAAAARSSRLQISEAVRRLQGTLIGPDQRTTCVILMFSPEALRRRSELVRLIRRSISVGCRVAEDEIRLAGPVIDGLSVDEASQRSLSRFAIPSAFIVFSVCWWSLRSFRAALIVFLMAAFCQAATLAIVDYSGESLSALLIILPPLIQVLAVSGGIHLMNYYFEAVESLPGPEAAVHAFHQGWLPCLLSSGTTAMGTASLMVSSLTPIRLFGVYATVGVVMTAAAVLTLIPCGLMLVSVPRRPRRESRGSSVLPRAVGPPHSHSCGRVAPQLAAEPPNDMATEADGHTAEWTDGVPSSGQPLSEPVVSTPGMPSSRMWERAHAFLNAHSLQVLAGGGAAMILAALGLPHVTTSVRIETLFSSQNRILQDYEWIEQHVGMLVPIEVLVTFDRNADINDRRKMETLRQVERVIRQVPDIHGVTSALTFFPGIPPLKDMSERVRTAVQTHAIAAAKPAFRELDMLVETDEGEVWRMTAHCSAVAPLDYGALLRNVETAAQGALRMSVADSGAAMSSQDNGGVVTTGIMPLVHEIQQQLLQDLFASLLSALLVITVTMTILEAGICNGLLAMVSNVFPIVMLFGIMGWMEYPMDVGSVMTASIALGIAVDDTLHFLTFFRRALNDGRDRAAAVLHSFQHCGPAMVQTSVSCGIGLLVFALSDFLPTSRFAVLMTILLLLALLGDLVLLPAILLSPLGRVFDVVRRGEPVSNR